MAMRGELSSGKFPKRHPLDWYVDEFWCGAQLLVALGGFADEKAAGLSIWDPAAGFGNTLNEFQGAGFGCYLSDIVDNINWGQYCEPYVYSPHVEAPIFFNGDFLEMKSAPARCSIVCNPPYSYRKGILEAFVRHALELATGRVCMLVPNKWLASQTRHRLFATDHPPALVLHLTQRPSMPPGDRIHLMGNRAFCGGMIDYCWIVWNVAAPTEPGETRTIWLPPLAGAR